MRRFAASLVLALVVVGGLGGAPGCKSSSLPTDGGGGGGGGGVGDSGAGGGDGGTGRPCSAQCLSGFVCCDGACVNPKNDVLNCGRCGSTCGGPHPYCGGGTCAPPPCEGNLQCFTGFCCGTTCCPNVDDLCCDVQGPGPSAGPKCFRGGDGGISTCNPGCPMCL